MGERDVHVGQYRGQQDGKEYGRGRRRRRRWSSDDEWIPSQVYPVDGSDHAFVEATPPARAQHHMDTRAQHQLFSAYCEAGSSFQAPMSPVVSTPAQEWPPETGYSMSPRGYNGGGGGYGGGSNGRGGGYDGRGYDRGGHQGRGYERGGYDGRGYDGGSHGGGAFGGGAFGGEAFGGGGSFRARRASEGSVTPEMMEALVEAQRQSLVLIQQEAEDQQFAWALANGVEESRRRLSSPAVEMDETEAVINALLDSAHQQRSEPQTRQRDYMAAHSTLLAPPDAGGDYEQSLPTHQDPIGQDPIGGEELRSEHDYEQQLLWEAQYGGTHPLSQGGRQRDSSAFEVRSGDDVQHTHTRQPHQGAMGVHTHSSNQDLSRRGLQPVNATAEEPAPVTATLITAPVVSVAPVSSPPNEVGAFAVDASSQSQHSYAPSVPSRTGGSSGGGRRRKPRRRSLADLPRVVSGGSINDDDSFRNDTPQSAAAGPSYGFSRDGTLGRVVARRAAPDPTTREPRRRGSHRRRYAADDGSATTLTRSEHMFRRSSNSLVDTNCYDCDREGGTVISGSLGNTASMAMPSPPSSPMFQTSAPVQVLLLDTSAMQKGTVTPTNSSSASSSQKDSSIGVMSAIAGWWARRKTDGTTSSGKDVTTDNDTTAFSKETGEPEHTSRMGESSLADAWTASRPPSRGERHNAALSGIPLPPIVGAADSEAQQQTLRSEASSAPKKTQSEELPLGKPTRHMEIDDVVPIGQPKAQNASNESQESPVAGDDSVVGSHTSAFSLEKKNQQRRKSVETGTFGDTVSRLRTGSTTASTVTSGSFLSAAASSQIHVRRKISDDALAPLSLSEPPRPDASVLKSSEEKREQFFARRGSAMDEISRSNRKIYQIPPSFTTLPTRGERANDELVVSSSHTKARPSSDEDVGVPPTPSKDFHDGVSIGAFAVPNRDDQSKHGVAEEKCNDLEVVNEESAKSATETHDPQKPSTGIDKTTVHNNRTFESTPVMTGSEVDKGTDFHKRRGSVHDEISRSARKLYRIPVPGMPRTSTTGGSGLASGRDGDREGADGDHGRHDRRHGSAQDEISRSPFASDRFPVQESRRMPTARGADDALPPLALAHPSENDAQVSSAFAGDNWGGRRRVEDEFRGSDDLAPLVGARSVKSGTEQSFPAASGTHEDVYRLRGSVNDEIRRSKRRVYQIPSHAPPVRSTESNGDNYQLSPGSSVDDAMAPLRGDRLDSVECEAPAVSPSVACKTKGPRGVQDEAGNDVAALAQPPQAASYRRGESPLRPNAVASSDQREDFYRQRGSVHDEISRSTRRVYRIPTVGTRIHPKSVPKSDNSESEAHRGSGRRRINDTRDTAAGEVLNAGENMDDPGAVSVPRAFSRLGDNRWTKMHSRSELKTRRQGSSLRDDRSGWSDSHPSGLSSTQDGWSAASSRRSILSKGSHSSSIDRLGKSSHRRADSSPIGHGESRTNGESLPQFEVFTKAVRGGTCEGCVVEHFEVDSYRGGQTATTGGFTPVRLNTETASREQTSRSYPDAYEISVADTRTFTTESKGVPTSINGYRADPVIDATKVPVLHNDEEENERKEEKRNFRVMSVIALLFVVGAASISTAIIRASPSSVNLLLSTEAPSAIPSMAPSTVPSMMPRSELLPVVAERLASVSDLETLLTRGTPQHEALRWIQAENSTRGFEDQRFVQRYVLAVFYFATGGDGWTDCHRNDIYTCVEEPFLSESDECLWNGVICAEDGLVFQIHWTESKGHGLTGTIPSELAWLQSLHTLILPNNKISGTIPAEIGNHPMKFIALSNNHMSGPLPETMRNNSFLGTLYYDRNRIGGTLPKEIFDVPNLLELKMEHNDLTGTIPTQIGRLNALTRLDLDGNYFTGPIPTEVGNLVDMEFLYLQNNSLTGTLPRELFNLTKLRNMNLSGNSLSGPIHPDVGNLGDGAPPMTNKFFFLQSNRFTGTIPTEFAQVPHLQSLGLEDNSFTGSIPIEICNVRARDSGGFQILSADCSAAGDDQVPEVSCSCCSNC